MLTLTPEGRRWAVANLNSSVVANVALQAGDPDCTWPQPFQLTSVEVANEQGLSHVGRVEGER